jgi:1,4-dihydroxy-2-naphthoyl-CoA hydrolase
VRPRTDGKGVGEGAVAGARRADVLGGAHNSDPTELVAAVNTAAGPLAHAMGIQFVEASSERVVATMPVEGNTQPYGLLHGGASCVLAESLGSTGAALHAGPDRIAVGVDINATHHHAVRSGVVTGIATPSHLGRSIVTYDIVIYDDEGRRICTARLTCALRAV